jgi:Fe-S-cluster containining protein
MPSPTPEDRLVDLFAKVDAFFAKTAASFPGPAGVTCHAGCDDCCQRRFSVTPLEAQAIALAVRAMPPLEREALRGAVAASSGPACVALVGGRCAFYAVRPIVCRTHGLPIRFAPAAPRALPMVDEASSIDACPRNFRGADIATLPTSAVLDQTTLSTLLGALDAARADAAGVPRGDRVDLAELLADSLTA